METNDKNKLAFGTNSSVIVNNCQICNSNNLTPIIFIGYLPPPSVMATIGERPREQSYYPTQVLYCSNCQLAQLGVVIDPKIVFPPSFPYTSGTTNALRDNFAQLYKEINNLYTFYFMN
jgi:hypothetical protein